MNKPFYKLCLLSFLFALLGTAVNAQQVLPTLQRAFNNYHQTALQEKLYVHTDKEVYLTGELAWFKIYYLNPEGNRPADLSKLAYVDVLDKENNSILQSKIEIKKGAGNGSLYIPVTALSGTYKIRAYTNWMKNYGPDVFFEKQVTFINPLKAPEKVNSSKTAIDLQFFPEGGDMVSEIPAKVAFKATGADGKGANLSGIIVNQRNETVARFQTTRFGMGQFTFTPVTNTSYKAIVNSLSNELLVKDLPEVKQNGYALSILDAGEDKLSVSVNTNVPAAEVVYLFIHNSEKLISAESARISGGSTKFVVDKIKLAEGISSLTLFDKRGQPVCERLYFKRPTKKLSIEANSDLAQYKGREKVSVNIVTKNEKGKEEQADLSVSIYQLDSLQAAEQSDIVSYLWLGSELKGDIESPNYYLQNDHQEANEALENLMLTQGWRHFKWDQVISQKKPLFRFLPELNGHLITGKLTDQAGHPGPQKMIHMGVPGERIQYYGAITDSTGRFMINTKDFYGANEIVLQTNFEGDRTYQISVESPFAERYRPNVYPDFLFTPALLHSLQSHSIGTQVQNIYSGNNLKQFYSPGIDSTAFYGQPFKTYNLDNYTRFNTMEEVLREYVAEVGVTRQQKSYHLKVLNDTRSLGGDPLVLLDGVPFLNMDQVMNINPLKIKSLAVVNHKYFWGPTTSAGILKLSTLKSDLNDIQLDPQAIVLDYEGMQLQREFYSPVYDSEAQKKGRIPDFRNTLYWSPEILTDAQGNSKVSFYTADQPGTYVGVIEGISKAGAPGKKVFVFKVSK